MFASMTCPFPEEVLSNSAAIIPIAHIIPPPAKSANKLTGATGGCPFRPRVLNIPVIKNWTTD